MAMIILKAINAFFHTNLIFHVQSYTLLACVRCHEVLDYYANCFLLHAACIRSRFHDVSGRCKSLFHHTNWACGSVHGSFLCLLKIPDLQTCLLAFFQNFLRQTLIFQSLPEEALLPLQDTCRVYP